MLGIIKIIMNLSFITFSIIISLVCNINIETIDDRVEFSNALITRDSIAISYRYTIIIFNSIDIIFYKIESFSKFFLNLKILFSPFYFLQKKNLNNTLL